MWKIVVGFIVFAAVAMFVIIKGGDKLDMGGEKHGEEAIHAPAAGASAALTPASASASAAVAAALAAVVTAPAASAASAAK